MAEGRFVLRYRGAGARPEQDVRRIGQIPGSRIVDDSGRMLLVEGPERDLHELVASMPEWVMAPEQTFAVPDTRERPRRPP
jgi:hypothetical protein